MPKNTAKTLEKLRAILADARANKLVCNLEPGSGPAPGESESGDDKAAGAATGAATGAAPAPDNSENKEAADTVPAKTVEDAPPKDNSKSTTDEVFDQPAKL